LAKLEFEFELESVGTFISATKRDEATCVQAGIGIRGGWSCCPAALIKFSTAKMALGMAGYVKMW